MQVAKTNVILVASSLLCCSGAKGITPDIGNPYQGIIDRNVFALKPIPVQTNNPTTGTPPPKITINGFTDILHKKQVLMTVAMPARPPEPPKQQTFILAPGERDGDIEVLDVDVNLGSVKLKNFGTEMLLTMDKDGAKLPASLPAVAPVPGAPMNAAGGLPPQNTYAPAANPGLKPLPQRTLRLGENTAATPYNNATAYNPPNINPSAAYNAAQGVNVNLGGNGQATLNLAQPGSGVYAQPHQVQLPQGPAISPDEQAINMLAQHQQNMDRGIPMPPLPPPLAEVYDGPKQENPPVPVQQNNNQQFFGPPPIPGQPMQPHR